VSLATDSYDRVLHAVQQLLVAVQSSNVPNYDTLSVWDNTEERTSTEISLMSCEQDFTQYREQVGQLAKNFELVIEEKEVCYLDYKYLIAPADR